MSHLDRPTRREASISADVEYAGVGDDDCYVDLRKYKVSDNIDAQGKQRFCNTIGQ